MTSLLPPLDPLTQASIGRGQSAIYNTKASAFVTVMKLDKGDWASATDREAVYELQNRMRTHVRKAAAGVPIAVKCETKFNEPLSKVFVGWLNHYVNVGWFE